MHTAPISRADVDRAGRFAVTASRRQDRAGLVAGRRQARCAPSACRPAPATSARPTPWRSAPTARRSPPAAGRAATEADAGADLPLRPRERRDDRPHRRPAERGPATSPSPPTATGWRRCSAAGACGSTPATATAAGRRSAADGDYGDQSYGVAFAADGRLATTSFDGRLRLYDADGSAAAARSRRRTPGPSASPSTRRTAGWRSASTMRPRWRSTTARRWRRCRRRTSAASTTAT